MSDGPDRPRNRPNVEPALRWPFSTYLAEHSHRVIYCPIPKVACSSLKLWFLRAAGLEIISTTDMHEIVAARQREHGLLADERHLRDPGYFKFAFVRNPLHRLVSAYLDKVVRVEVEVSPARAAIETIQRTKLSRNDPARRVSFREFVEYVVATPDTELDEHFRSQHPFLGDVEWNLLGRVEELERGMARVIAAVGFGAHVPVPRINYLPYESQPASACAADWLAPRLRAQTPWPHWRDFYDERLRCLTEERYRRDWELWSQATCPEDAVSTRADTGSV